MPDKKLYVNNASGFLAVQHAEVPEFAKLSPQDFFHKELPPLGTGKGVKVCLIDTGVADHEHLKNVVNAANLGASERSSDFTGHAHAAAGLISSNDPGSLVGLAPEAQLCFAKPCDDRGEATAEAVAAAVVWGIVVGAQVIVVSFVPDDESEVLWQAVQKAVDSNILVVMDGIRPWGVLPTGVVSTDGMKSRDKLLVTTAMDGEFAEVKAEYFSPAIVGAVAALLVERAASASKKGKASTMAKQIMALLKG